MDHHTPVPDYGEVRVESRPHSAIASEVATPTPKPPYGKREKRRRGPRWFVWLIGSLLGVVLVILLMCALIGGLVLGIAIKLANEVTASTTSTQTFTVSGSPMLDIHNATGNLTVQPGDAGSVSAQITRKARDTSQDGAQTSLQQIMVTTSQAGDMITLTTSFPDGGYFGGSSSVDLLLTVPPNTNISANIASGDIDITGVTGRMSLTQEAGKANLQQVALLDGSQMQIATGDLTMQGIVAPNASVSIMVKTGDVTLQLPADTQTRLDARTDVGNIQTDGWQIPTAHANTVGTVANDVLGTQPTSTITIHVSTGDIYLSQSAQNH